MGYRPSSVDRDSFRALQHEYPDPPKTVHEFTLPVRDDAAVVIAIGDWHLGLKACYREKLEAYLRYIEQRPNHAVLLVGDLGETATKTSVGKAMFDEDIHIPAQQKLIAEMLTPLAKQGQILGVVPGNHEGRIAQQLGIDVTEQLADRLGFPHLGYQGYLACHVGDQTYTIMVAHGKSAAATPAGQLNAARKLANIAPAMDVLVSGHSHALMHTSDQVLVYDPAAKEMRMHRRTFVVAGSFVRYEGYPVESLLTPQITGCARIGLRADRHDVIVAT